MKLLKTEMKNYISNLELWADYFEVATKPEFIP